MSSPQDFKPLEMYSHHEGVFIHLDWERPAGTFIRLCDRLVMIHEQVNQVHSLHPGFACPDLKRKAHAV